MVEPVQRNRRSAAGIAAAAAVVRSTPIVTSGSHCEDIIQRMELGLYVYRLEDPADDHSLCLILANPTSAAILGRPVNDIVGKRIDDLFPGLRAPGIPGKFARVVTTGKSMDSEEIRYGEHGAHFWYSFTAFPLPGNCVGVLFSDITDKKRQDEKRRMDQERLEAMLQLNRMSGHSVQEIANFTVEQSVRITDSALGYLAFYEEEERILTMHAWSSSAMAECRMASKPRIYTLDETGLWGEAVRQRKPVITNDYTAVSPLKKGYPAGHVPLTRHMNIPLFDGSRIVAVIGVGNKAGPYDETDVAQLTLLGQGTWEIIQRKRAEEALRAAKQSLNQRLVALTQPVGELHHLKFTDLFDVAEIQDIQDAFARATGVASIITDAEGQPITQPSRFCRLCSDIIRRTPAGNANCMKSDAFAASGRNPDGPIVATCLSGGLLDGGAVISVGDYPIAHWLIGQVLDETADRRKLEEYAAVIGADPVRYREALAEVPHMSRGHFAEIAQALFLLARQLSKLAVQNVQQARIIAAKEGAEEKISRLNNALEQRVLERTAQLENANRELESFSYTVSHDLRAPLRAIDGFAAILKEDYDARLDDEGRRILGVVHDNVMRMSQLIDGLLEFARLGRKELARVAVKMDDLARLVFDELRGINPGRDIRFSLGILPPASGDPVMIRQVLSNLLGNAIKFTRGRDKAVIEAGSCDKDGELVYYVRDNGVGFDMEYADKLFKVFNRLHTMDEFEGTGVGLAIVRRIIDRHHGRIWAEALPGGGATFYFTLPPG